MCEAFPDSAPVVVCAKRGYCVSPARLPGCWQGRRSAAWRRHCVGTQQRCSGPQSLPVAVPMTAAAAMRGGGGGEPRGGGRQPGVEAHCSPSPEPARPSVPSLPPLCSVHGRASACSEGHAELGRRAGRVRAGRTRGVGAFDEVGLGGRPTPCRKRSFKGRSSRSSDLPRRRGRAAGGAVRWRLASKHLRQVQVQVREARAGFLASEEESLGSSEPLHPLSTAPSVSLFLAVETRGRTPRGMGRGRWRATFGLGSCPTGRQGGPRCLAAEEFPPSAGGSREAPAGPPSRRFPCVPVSAPRFRAAPREGAGRGLRCRGRCPPAPAAHTCWRTGCAPDRKWSRPLVAGALAVFSAIPQPSAPLTDSCLRPPAPTVSRKAGTRVALVETPQPGLHTQGRWYSFKLRTTDPIPDSGLAVPAENRSSMIDRYRNTGRLCHKRDKNVNYLCTWRPVLPDSGPALLTLEVLPEA